MSSLSSLEKVFEQFNQLVYKYLIFLYYKEGFAKVLTCLVFGAVTALALPPFYLFFLLPIAIPSIIRMTDFSKTKLSAFNVGFWFSFGFYFVSLYWVPLSLLHDASTSWFFPIVLILLPVALSAFNALGFVLYFFLASYSFAVEKVIIFSLTWVLFEYLRGYIVYSFPWNFLGYSVSAYSHISQAASIVGVLGLSTILMLWSSSFHLLFLTGDKSEFSNYIMIIVFFTLSVVVCWGFGFSRMSEKVIIDKTDHEFKILLVQGNSAMRTDADQYGGFMSYISLTEKYIRDDIDLTIWPEGSHNFLIKREHKIRKKILSLINRDQFISINSLRKEDISEKYYSIYNSIVFMKHNAESVHYDKNYLVPFGEYLPLRGSLETLFQWLKLSSVTSFTQSFTGDISSGKGMRVASLSENMPPFVPLICYEIAFSGKIIPTSSDIEPKWILNTTNDKWFFNTSGPVQHYRTAQMRSIEEGIPVVRSANNGISAVFDPYGRVIHKIPYNKTAALEIVLPNYRRVPTVFGIIGNIPLIVSIIAYLCYKFANVLYIKFDAKINKGVAITYSIILSVNKSFSKKQLNEEQANKDKEKAKK